MDKKISELTELLTPSATDVLPIVNSGATKQIQWGNLALLPLAGGTVTGRLTYPGIFGGIYVHDAAAVQAIPNGVTYTKLTCYVGNGPSSDVTPDAANDKITLTVAGYYLVNCSLNFSAGNNKIFRMAPFLGGVEQDAIHIVRKIGTAGDVGSASFSGILTVAAVPVDLDVRARHDDAAPINITMAYSNLSVHYVGTG